MTGPGAAVAAKQGNGGGGSTSTNVRVVARIRPLSTKEVERGSKESVTSLANNKSSSRNKENNINVGASSSSSTECMQVVDNGQKRFFELDRVFAQDCTQEEIYVGCGARRAVTDELFRGFNCTILAYGQTGAGKTFTMGSAAGASSDLGKINDGDGIIARSVSDLFDTIQARCDGNARVELSYLEIYNEEIRDLMATSQKKLVVRETMNGTVYVQGSEYREVQNAADIGKLMQEAGDRRVVASTAMNAVSSRSHAICTLRIQGVLENDDKFSSKLTLVDLAGSERIKKTGAQGNRRQEGININKGLFVLGQVVSALSEAGRGGMKRKPPYRDSKLTRLLQDSLGGNSRTIMVACCSPADYNTEETINTLRYATSARNIKNTATRNLVKQISPEEAAKLARENQLLLKQVAELQSLLKVALASSGNGGGGGEEDGDEKEETETDVNEKGDDNDDAAGADSDADAEDGKKSAPKRAVAAADAAAEVPALHMEIEKLKQQVEELQDVEKENVELTQQLADARVDAEASRKAAEQLSDIMDKIQELKEDEIEKKRTEYRHKKKEEQWIDFVHNLLKQQGLQLVKLWYDFELVQRLVTQPIVLKQVGNKTFAVKPKLGYQNGNNNRRGGGGRSRWFRGADTGEADRLDPVDDPDEYQMQLLKEHIDFFKKRMREAQADVEKECDDLEGMKISIASVQKELLAEIGSDEIKQEAVGKENNLLDQLTTMLLQPATVLAAQVPESVLGGDGNTTVAESTARDGGGGDIPRFIDIVPGGDECGDDRTVGTATTVGGTTKRTGWLLRWRGQAAESDDDDAAVAAASGPASVASDEPAAGDDDGDDDETAGNSKTSDGCAVARQTSDESKSVTSQASRFTSTSTRARSLGQKVQGGWFSGLKDMVHLDSEVGANGPDDDGGGGGSSSKKEAACSVPESAENHNDDDPAAVATGGRGKAGQKDGTPAKTSRWLGKVSQLVSLEDEVSGHDSSDDEDGDGKETVPSDQQSKGWFSRVRNYGTELRTSASNASGDSILPVIDESAVTDDTDAKSTGENDKAKTEDDSAIADCTAEDVDSDCPRTARSSTSGSASSQEGDGDTGGRISYDKDASEEADPLADMLMTRQWGERQMTKTERSGADSPAQSE